MSKLTRMILIFIVTATAACSSLRFPGVFRIDVPQGNIITQDNVDKLKLGMTTRQVEYVMGTPMVQDPFHPSRWDYFYHLETGKGLTLANHLVLYFDNDTLVKVDKSDYKDNQGLADEVAQKLKVEADLGRHRKTFASPTEAVPHH